MSIINKIEIVSRHSSVAEAVKAAGLTRPSYENSLADAIRHADNPPARWNMKPVTG